MSLAGPQQMFAPPSAFQAQMVVPSPGQTPATPVHMFWTPDPSERVRERHHKRSPSANASASAGASHNPSATNSRSSSVSSRNDGLGVRFSPNQVGQQLSLFDGGAMNGTIRAPSGSNGANELFASIMEGHEHDGEDSDEENDSDEEEHDDHDNEGSGGLFGGAGGGGGNSSLGLGFGFGPAPSISVSSSSRSEMSAMMSGTSNKSGMNTSIWVPAAAVPGPQSATTPKASSRRDKERKSERGEGWQGEGEGK